VTGRVVGTRSTLHFRTTILLRSAADDSDSDGGPGVIFIRLGCSTSRVHTFVGCTHASDSGPGAFTVQFENSKAGWYASMLGSAMKSSKGLWELGPKVLVGSSQCDGAS
jgi:hypothetical protein